MRSPSSSFSPAMHTANGDGITYRPPLITIDYEPFVVRVALNECLIVAS